MVQSTRTGVPVRREGRVFGRHEYERRYVFGWPIYSPKVRKRRTPSAMSYIGRHRPLLSLKTWWR